MTSRPIPQNTASLLAGLLLLFLMTGCSHLGASNIKATEKLTDKEANEFYCLTDKYSVARNCALLSIDEFSDLLKKTGDYERISAYLLLLSGTASAIGETFDMDEDVLKSGAILAGTVLGARSISDPDLRREVLSRGLKELTCAVRVAEAAHKVDTSQAAFGSDLALLDTDGTRFHLFQGGSGYSAYSLSQDLYRLNADAIRMNQSDGDDATLGEDLAFVAAYDATRSSLAIFGMYDQGQRLELALQAARNEAGTFLSASVIEIRAAVRKGLSGGIAGIEDLATSQQQRIKDLLKESVDESESPPPPELLLDPAGARSALHSESQRLQDEASGIRAAYKACVGESD